MKKKDVQSMVRLMLTPVLMVILGIVLVVRPDSASALVGKVLGWVLLVVGIGLLVGLMDIATANNTVAIVMAGPIAKEVAEEYGISPKRSASLLDTFSCIFQGIIPYGAQMLVAISTCATLGYAISAFDIIPLLFYPFLLCLSSLLFILFDKK